MKNGAGKNLLDDNQPTAWLQLLRLWESLWPKVLTHPRGSSPGAAPPLCRLYTNQKANHIRDSEPPFINPPGAYFANLLCKQNAIGSRYGWYKYMCFFLAFTGVITHLNYILDIGYWIGPIKSHLYSQVTLFITPNANNNWTYMLEKNNLCGNNDGKKSTYNQNFANQTKKKMNLHPYEDKKNRPNNS